MFFKKKKQPDYTVDSVEKYISRYITETKPDEKPATGENVGSGPKIRPAPSGNDDVKYSTRDPIPDNESYIRYSMRGTSDRFDKEKAYDIIDSAYMNGAASGESFRQHTEMTFVEKLLDYLSIKNLSDSKVYKRAQIDRRLYSKIVCDNDYKPSKDTCIALCVGLQLNLEKATDMLRRAGYTFSHSSKRDIIIEYCFENSIWDMNTINEILYKFSEKLLGR